MICRVLAVSTSGFYAWTTRAPSRRAHDDATLTQAVVQVHRRARSIYGSPRVHRALARLGVHVGRKRVARLMRREGLVGRKRRRFRNTTDSKHGDPIAPNLLGRNFTSEEPGRVMVGDTTAIETRQGWLYLAILLDLCTRAIVGWAMGETNDTALVTRALKMALPRGFRRGFIHHTDRGCTYASADYRTLVEDAGGRRSMSRKADCYDNAVAESAFRTIKEEGLGQKVPENQETARALVFSFVEGFYNTERLHSTLGYVTPIEFEHMKLEERSRKHKTAK